MRVSNTCLVILDRNRYSVPAEFAGRVVSARTTATLAWNSTAVDIPALNKALHAVIGAEISLDLQPLEQPPRGAALGFWHQAFGP